MSWEIGVDIYTLLILCIKYVSNEKLLVKNLPAMQETRVQFLGQENPLEKKMATHCSILVWEVTWTEEPGRLQSMVLRELDTT